MKRFFAVSIIALTFAASSVHAEVPLGKEGVRDRVMIIFAKGTPLKEQKKIAAAQGLEVIRVFRPLNALVVRSQPGKARLASFQLAAHPKVGHVARDFYTNWLYGAPALPEYQKRVADLMKGIHSVVPDLGKAPSGPGDFGEAKWGMEKVNAPSAWSRTRGKGVKVAVIDTGIDFDHPEITTVGGYNAIDSSVSYKDDNGHGTHVAGTIAAADNDIGVVGIAPDVSLYGVKVLNARGRGTFAGVIDGIQWAVQNGMDVANMSLGASRGTEALKDAMDAAKAAGTIIIAAAGNSGGSVGYPAAYDSAIAVAASNSSDKVAYFSSRGSEVDLIAPGVSIKSTYLGGGYRSLSGTSMACPHITGLAALAVANGASGWDAVKAALEGAASPLEGDIPREQQGAGMVDAGKLVQ